MVCTSQPAVLSAEGVPAHSQGRPLGCTQREGTLSVPAHPGLVGEFGAFLGSRPSEDRLELQVPGPRPPLIL